MSESKCNMSKPCNDCPFRQDSTKGWLGAYSPEEVISVISNDQPFYCHVDVQNRHGYEKDDWQEWAENHGEQCAGAMIFANNICKLSRDPMKMAAQQKLGRDKDTVFSTPQQFIEHHSVTIDGKRRKQRMAD